MVGVTVFDANDNEIGGFEFEVPKKVFFPITYDAGDESYLSFYPEGGTNILSGGYLRCGIEYTALGPLIGKFPLNLIGRIEYKFFPALAVYLVSNALRELRHMKHQLGQRFVENEAIVMN